jgi:hypothetical protein
VKNTFHMFNVLSVIFALIACSDQKAGQDAQEKLDKQQSNLAEYKKMVELYEQARLRLIKKGQGCRGTIISDGDIRQFIKNKYEKRPPCVTSYLNNGVLYTECDAIAPEQYEGRYEIYDNQICKYLTNDKDATADCSRIIKRENRIYKEVINSKYELECVEGNYSQFEVGR